MWIRSRECSHSSAAAAVLHLELRSNEHSEAHLDQSDILLAAIEPIDKPLREKLADGTIRLLRSEWLASWDGAIMLRRQDLPEEAFVPVEEAVAMLERGDRTVLVVSHSWQHPDHPDPLGITLDAARRYVLTQGGQNCASSTVDGGDLWGVSWAYRGAFGALPGASGSAPPPAELSFPQLPLRHREAAQNHHGLAGISLRWKYCSLF